MENQAKPLKAQVIIIGDEILSGKIIDTNTKKLATWLELQGFSLKRVTTTSDSREELLEVLELAWKSSDLVVTTGGLGPTEDDITKQVIGEFFKAKLEPNERAAGLAKEHYQRIQKDWSPQTNSYHLIPKGMLALGNPKGLAPGLLMETLGKVLLCAPGVPRELVGMLEETFPPYLDQYFPNRKVLTQVMTMRTHGIPEEKIFFELMPHLWQELSKEGKVSSLPQVLGVDIHLTFNGDENDLKEKKERWKAKLSNSPLGPHIWLWEHSPLEKVVLKEAREKNLTLALAESCTGGLVAHRLTNIPGSSDILLGSIVAYANEVKEKVLEVSSQTLKTFGAVSEETAKEMAIGVRKTINADISLSLSGIAGPGGGTEEKPVGTVCIGQDSKLGTKSKRYQFRGDREYLKLRFSEMGLHLILEMIRNH